MAKKTRLGLNLFFSNSSNSGIVNYIYNIVCALKTLPAKHQPAIVMFHTKDASIDSIKEADYPDIQFIEFTPYSKYRVINGVNKLILKVTGYNIRSEIKYLRKIDVFYPYLEYWHQAFKTFRHKIHWLVDFNNIPFAAHYADNGKAVTEQQQKLTQTTDHIVLSSNALLQELKSYFPDYRNDVSILRFACTLPDLSKVDVTGLIKKHDLNGIYLMSPNQFWEHKNQLLLVKALIVLKERVQLNFKVAFTGSTSVNRGKGHMLEKLLHLVKEHELEAHVKFLGLLNRDEQLALMKQADALIQPSLYEGWSTLVEEAKALNKKIVLSDIPVHREQECVNSYFFSPYSPVAMADAIYECINSQSVRRIDYNKNVEQFGLDVLKTINHELEKKYPLRFS